MSAIQNLPFSKVRTAAGLAFLSGEMPFAAFNADAAHLRDPLPVRATVCAGLVAPARIEVCVTAALRT